MLNPNQFRFNADGTIAGLSNTVNFGEQIDKIYTPSEYPFGLFGQGIVDSLNNQVYSGVSSVSTTIGAAGPNKLILGVGVALALGAGLMLIKKAAK